MEPPEKGATENAWDPEDYDGKHAFVFEYGSDVLSLLEPAADERILDLGCGTGQLTTQIAESGAEVVGLDSSATMIAEAQTSCPDCTFVRADARDFEFAEPFDAVFSNAMLHWVTDQDAVLASVHDALRPGGRFVAELGGVGNVGRIVEATLSELTKRGYEGRNSWYFPSVGEHAGRLEDHGFEVRYARLFDRPTELTGGETGLAAWFDMFGDDLLAPLTPAEREEVVGSVEDRLRKDQFQNGSWIADYRRLRFIAIRS